MLSLCGTEELMGPYFLLLDSYSTAKTGLKAGDVGTICNSPIVELCNTTCFCVFLRVLHGHKGPGQDLYNWSV